MNVRKNWKIRGKSNQVTRCNDVGKRAGAGGRSEYYEWRVIVTLQVL